MADEKRAVLLGTFMGMVLSMCRQLGLSDDETVNVFSAQNIRAGFDILEGKGADSMTALSDELKPCPFCGGAAALLPRTCDKNTPYNPADRAFPVARCGQCGAEAVGKDWGRPETAAEKWNTRALLAAQPVAALASELAAIGATADPQAWDSVQPAVQQPAKAWGITYNGVLQPTIYESEDEAAQEVKRRQDKYPHDNAPRAVMPLWSVQQPAEDAELLAETPTPKPQVGLWTLIAPNGRMYQADSPLRCCGLEQRERVPADVAMARILRAASEPDDSELLDWLDATNKRFKMGWKVGVAPAGNCSVQSIICLGNSEPATIRAAIRAAIKAQGGKQ